MGKVAIVTGINGQDGSLLADFLLSLKIQSGSARFNEYDYVVGMARRTSSPTNWRHEELKLVDNPRFVITSGDLTDSSSIDRVIKKYQPNEFYNLGAMSFVKESWNTPIATMDINANGTIRCLEALRKFKSDCKFYQASSSEMFGGANRIEILDENSEWHPRSPYGVSKLAAHWATINYRESYDMFCCCGILFNHESEYRGIEFVTRKITDAVARIKLGLQNKIILGNLDAKRDWGRAQDFVRAMYLMLQQDNPDDYIIATGIAHSIRDFVAESIKAAGLTGGVDDFVVQDSKYMRPADVGHLLGDAGKARRELRWYSRSGFDAMVWQMVMKDIERIKGEC